MTPLSQAVLSLVVSASDRKAKCNYCDRTVAQNLTEINSTDRIVR